jgi:hypothetical protein
MEEFAPCAVCARIPLIGEEVTMVGAAQCEAAVCDLCLRKPRAVALGEPLRRERVRSAAGAESVHRVLPGPVEPVQAPIAAAAADFLR